MNKIIIRRDQRLVIQIKFWIVCMNLREIENGYKVETKVIPLFKYFNCICWFWNWFRNKYSFDFARDLYKDKNKEYVKIIGYQAIGTGEIILNGISLIEYSNFYILNQPLILADLNTEAGTGISSSRAKVHLKGVYNLITGIRGRIKYKNILGKTYTICKFSKFLLFWSLSYWLCSSIYNRSKL